MSHSTPPEDPSDPDLRAGDEVHEDTEEAGEDICPSCGGSGEDDSGSSCPVCAGSGRVREGAGGG
jgi:DnaJ-class molecular chaperone